MTFPALFSRDSNLTRQGQNLEYGLTIYGQCAKLQDVFEK